MKKLPYAAALILSATIAKGQTVQRIWSNTFGIPGSGLYAECLLPFQSSSGLYEEAVGVWSEVEAAGYCIVLGNNDVAKPVFLTSTSAGKSGFIPYYLSTDTFNIYLKPELVGKQMVSNGSKTLFLGSENFWTSGFVNGSLDYTYNPNTVSTDWPLCIGSYPYSKYVAANVQTGSATQRGLVILDTRVGYANPTVMFTDDAIHPLMGAFSFNLICVAGEDNNAPAPGAAKATVYQVNPNGTLRFVFTVKSPNTIVNHVSTTHWYTWGTLPNKFNVLADNMQVHDANKGTITQSYTLTAYDPTAHKLWSTAPQPGEALGVSVASPTSTYVLGKLVNGTKFLSAFQNGSFVWSIPTSAVKIATAADEGVIAADNLPDGTGHKHIHVTKYAPAGTILWNFTYSREATTDDLLFEMTWQGGRLFMTGQYQMPTGSAGLWGAEYDQVPL